MLICTAIRCLVSDIEKAFFDWISANSVFLGKCATNDKIHSIGLVFWNKVQNSRLHDIASYVDVSLYFWLFLPCLYLVCLVHLYESVWKPGLVFVQSHGNKGFFPFVIIDHVFQIKIKN